MSYRLWDWFTTKQEVKDDDIMSLQKALEANRVAARQAIKIQTEGKEKSQHLLRLSEDALKILERK